MARIRILCSFSLREIMLLPPLYLAMFSNREIIVDIILSYPPVSVNGDCITQALIMILSLA